jgi:hypothetical protein
MALGASYATTAELKARLRISDATHDTQLGEALSTASRGIEFCCHRQFNDAGGTSARTLYATCESFALVPDFHTTTGLIIKTDAGGDGTFETTWSSTDYELHPLDGVVNDVTGWPFSKIRAVTRTFPARTKRANLQVTAHWGWTAVPAPIKEATLILAEDLFKLRDTPFGVGGYGEYGRIRARENPNVWMRISPYVRDAVLVA